MKPFVSMILFTIGTMLFATSIAYFCNVGNLADRLLNSGTLIFIILGIMGIVLDLISIRLLISYIREADNRYKS